tara:strand:- start:2334 stop:2597 length:264 start_codon:yes stop_codon:yes gene_type:complete
LNRPPLTPAQEQVYTYIVEFQKVHKNRTPSLREIGSGFIDGKKVIPERKSKGSTYKLVKTLVKKNYVTQKFYENVPYWVVENDKQDS